MATVGMFFSLLSQIKTFIYLLSNCYRSGIRLCAEDMKLNAVSCVIYRFTAYLVCPICVCVYKHIYEIKIYTKYTKIVKKKKLQLNRIGTLTEESKKCYKRTKPKMINSEEFQEVSRSQ